jgi:hypothetical protein
MRMPPVCGEKQLLSVLLGFFLLSEDADKDKTEGEPAAPAAAEGASP